MTSWKTAVLFIGCFCTSLGFSQVTTPGNSPSPPASTGQSEKAALRERLLSTLPPSLLDKWKKYGQWDYKQRGFQYREFTQFNYGATGAAAGLNKDALLALARAFKPDPEDITALIDSGLDSNFARNADAFDKLRRMAEQDLHVTRIANDYTWLDDKNAWPREDVGFSEARWNEYRTLFKTLSLSDGIVRSQDFVGAIFFISQAEGLCTGGSSDGYVYSTKPLMPVTKSPAEALDAEARKNPDRHDAFVFTSLKENWYVFYQVDW